MVDHMKTKKLIWYSVDLDGTLADTQPPNFKLSESKPIAKNIEKLYEVVNASYKIMIYTARHWDDYQEIEEWLHKYEIPFKAIWCGKPLVHKMVDDKAINANDESWL